MNNLKTRHKVTIIGNYFGTPPSIFQLWLDSCAPNTFFSWIVFSDIDSSRFNIPRNVKIIYITMSEFKKRLESSFPYKIRYDKPWDACAFKPCTGGIFRDVLRGSDYWGWTDFDLIYGDLRPVYKMIGRYDKILPNGHLSIVKNDESLNQFILSHPLTEKALSIKYEGLSCFDEGAFRTRILPEFGASEDGEQIPYVHLRPRAGSFRLGTSIACANVLGLGRYPDIPFVLTWNRGLLTAHFVVGKNQVTKLSVAYVHFFRREIVAKVLRLNYDQHYLIKPNVIEEYDGHELGAIEIAQIDAPRIHWKYFMKRLTIKTFLNKIEKLSGKRTPYE